MSSRPALMTVLVLATIAVLATGAAVFASSGASTEPASRDAKVEVRGESVSRDSTTTSTSTPAPVPTTSPVTEAESSTPAPAPAPAAPAPTAPQTMILVCETAVTNADGIETSSQTATRVPVGTPVPAGCWIG